MNNAPPEDLRILRCFDAIAFSYQVLEYNYELLYPNCCLIPEDNKYVGAAISNAWMFVDFLYKIRELSQGMPSLSQKDPNIRIFLRATEIAETYRHYIQHLRNEVMKTDIDSFPVWGSLSWLEPKVTNQICIVILGSRVGHISNPSVVFDTETKTFVSKVSLSVMDQSFNFDLIKAALDKFKEFIFPWFEQTWQGSKKIVDKYPVARFDLKFPTEEAKP